MGVRQLGRKRPAGGGSVPESTGAATDEASGTVRPFLSCTAERLDCCPAERFLFPHLQSASAVEVLPTAPIFHEQKLPNNHVNVRDANRRNHAGSAAYHARSADRRRRDGPRRRDGCPRRTPGGARRRNFGFWLRAGLPSPSKKLRVLPTSEIVQPFLMHPIPLRSEMFSTGF